jgi:hypothetical protein
MDTGSPFFPPVLSPCYIFAKYPRSRLPVFHMCPGTCPPSSKSRRSLKLSTHTAPFPDTRPALWPRLSFSGLRARRLRHTSWKSQRRPTTARPRYSHRSRLPIRLAGLRARRARVPHAPSLLSLLRILNPSPSCSVSSPLTFLCPSLSPPSPAPALLFALTSAISGGCSTRL